MFIISYNVLIFYIYICRDVICIICIDDVILNVKYMFMILFNVFVYS